MGSPQYDETFKMQVLDEALKGDRPINKVAEQFEMIGGTLRTWLRDHYVANPDDPRRHYIERESERFKRDESSAPEGYAEPSDTEKQTADVEEEGANDDEAREDMGHKPGKGKGFAIDDKSRAKILAEVAKGERTRDEIAAAYGISPSTITQWKKEQRQPDHPKMAPFFAMLDKGTSLQAARKKMGLSGKTTRRWEEVYRKRKAKEARVEGLVKARAAHAEKMKDPAYREEMRLRNHRNRAAAEAQGQLQLPQPTVTPTLVSRPEPPPSVREFLPPSQPASGLVRYVGQPPPPQQVASAAMGEMFEECVEERATLRGMVKILEREKLDLEKKLTAYKRLFGEIQV